MGNWNSGRRPQPTALKLLRGNPGRRRIVADPVFPPLTDTFDRPPRELTGNTRARAEWRRIVPLLRVAGIVTAAERSALIAVCLEWSSYLAAQVAIAAEGHCQTDKNGQLKQSPYLEIADRVLANCHRLWGELGLTPSGRARVARIPPARTPPTSAKMAPTPASKWAGLI